MAPAMPANPTISEPERETTTGDPQRMLLDPSEYPNIDHIETEDGQPVDSIYAAKQQRLLVESLYASWQPVPHAPF